MEQQGGKKGGSIRALVCLPEMFHVEHFERYSNNRRMFHVEQLVLLSMFHVEHSGRCPNTDLMFHVEQLVLVSMFHVEHSGLNGCGLRCSTCGTIVLRVLGAAMFHVEQL